MKRYNVIVMAGLLLLAGCSGNGNDPDAYGNFESGDVMISAQTQGECLLCKVEEGEEIKRSDTIVVIDTVDFHLQIQKLKMQKQGVKAKFPSVTAQVEVQQEKLNTLRKDEERIKNMLAQNAATQKQLDDIQGQINMTEKSIEQIKTQNNSLFAELDVLDAGIDRLRDKIKRAVVLSPMDATALEVFVEQYELVMPGKPIVKLADMNEMTLKAWIAGNQLSEVKIGQEVTVRIDKGDGGYYEYPGRVSYVAAKAEFTPSVIQTKEERVDMVYAMKIKVVNDGRIKIGMPGEVMF
ncbi:MAG: HlyD family efflux transporter periplasmic adaptor subunit [Candidatus Delongbacteria bacterium]|nr:HlyD family efflux transporter periplasmic adaptor subunit [Candidatus Delongbacteria bacterium]